LECSSATGLTQAASTVICIVEQPDWRIYITPALVALSAIIAFIAMLNARRVAKERATLDLIEKVESGDHYRKITKTFSELRRGRGFAHLSNPKLEEDKEARRCVNDYLNHYELVSIGILSGLLDETVYRSWMRGPFVRDWNAASDWVQRERWKRQDDGTWEYYGQVFMNYEIVARKWSHEAKALDETSGGPPPEIEAGGPSDEPLPAATEDGMTKSEKRAVEAAALASSGDAISPAADPVLDKKR
jgi:hypothetical protein